MPLRLALVRQRYTAFGGAERFVAAALEALAREGVGLSLYTRSWPEAQAPFEILPPFEILRINPPYLGNVWRDFGFARALRRSLAKDRPTLVQSHERIAGCDLYRAGDGVHAVWLEERRRGLGLPGRLAIALNPYHHYVLAAERRMFCHAALRAVICNSRMVMDEIASRFPVPRERLHLVYNAVDCERFSPALRERGRVLRERLGWGGEHLVCLLLGSGYARKGLEAALLALAGLPQRYTLLVVGRDKNLPVWKRRAAALGLGDRVHFLGPVEDPGEAYGASDLFLLPTIYDPCPNAGLEAMASGLPVVTSAKCGLAEILAEKGGGRVCEARDVAALRAAVLAYAEPERRSREGAAARAAVLPLSAAAMSGQLLELYHHLLAEAGGRGQGV